MEKGRQRIQRGRALSHQKRHWSLVGLLLGDSHILYALLVSIVDEEITGLITLKECSH